MLLTRFLYARGLRPYSAFGGDRDGRPAALPAFARFAFARFALANELAFRGNFFMKVLVELLWLVHPADLLPDHLQATRAAWPAGTQHAYLFFVGCYYAMEGLIETLFLENCTEFADLVRSGNLDQYLLKPHRRAVPDHLPQVRLVHGAEAPARRRRSWATPCLACTGRFSLFQLLSFLILFVCGTALAYSFLLLLTSTSVWFMRNQSLMEMWWLLTTRDALSPADL